MSTVNKTIRANKMGTTHTQTSKFTLNESVNDKVTVY